MKGSSLLSVFIIIAVYFIGVFYLLSYVDVKQKSTDFDRPNCANREINTSIILEKEQHVLQQDTKVFEGVASQYGPGANGKAVLYDKDKFSEEELTEMKKAVDFHDYNGFISDTISVQRTLTDYRPEACKRLQYPDNLPKVSIIIPFREERLSVLLRTVYSLLHNSPAHLLEEIILVDDASTLNDIQTKLEIHVNALSKVKLIRKTENVGLMMARQAGIDASKTDYFICMDSHMEVFPGWLEPILDRLVHNPKALVCSNIGGIDSDNFRVSHRTPHLSFYDFPFFTWNMEQQQAHYKKEYIRAHTNTTTPVLMGSVMGMMVCMKKSWFMQLGGFDPGMRVWGSEQIELSIKVWSCGGVIELVPCSFVAHIYRRIVWDVGEKGLVNKYRMVEVWVDEPYRQIIYDYNYKKRHHVQIGDISDRVSMRRRNKCKPFQYFIDKVREFANIHTPIDVQNRGSLKNEHSNLCLDTGWPNGPIVYSCHGNGGNQIFEYTDQQELRHLGECVIPTPDKSHVIFRHCDHFENAEDKVWLYDVIELTMMHLKSRLCLTALEESKELITSQCSSSPSQKWIWIPISQQ